MKEKILVVPEIAKFFGVTKKTVYEWCRSGHLPAFKIGQEWMVRQSDLQKMISGKLSLSSRQAGKRTSSRTLGF